MRMAGGLRRVGLKWFSRLTDFKPFIGIIHISWGFRRRGPRASILFHPLAGQAKIKTYCAQRDVELRFFSPASDDNDRPLPHGCICTVRASG